MITSSSNAQVRQILRLNTKARFRRKLGLFTAEGVKLFREAPPELREKIYVSSSFEKKNRELLKGIFYEIVDDRVFFGMCDSKTPQGILTVLKIPSYERKDLLRVAHPLLLVLEDLQDPGNVGTILRTAEGAGVTGVILSKKCVDLSNPKTIRSTMGSIFRVPFIYENQLKDAVSWLKAFGIRTFAAHLHGKHLYNEEDYTGGSAFLIGNEAKGLSEELAKSCDCLLRIPMEGQVKSLNAAVAAAVLMYMANLQRYY